jgi:predicted GH43/DUF377 family glycosyl hydrolase
MMRFNPNRGYGVLPASTIAALRVILQALFRNEYKTPAPPDFVHFKFSALNGPAVQNKGMALFPRKINGQFAMLLRQDDENILLMFSLCGALLHGRELIIPYAMSDSATSFATVSLDELLAAME